MLEYLAEIEKTASGVVVDHIAHRVDPIALTCFSLDLCLLCSSLSILLFTFTVFGLVVSPPMQLDVHITCSQETEPLGTGGPSLSCISQLL